MCVGAILGGGALMASGQQVPALVVESQDDWRAAIGLCVAGFSGLRDLGTYTALPGLFLRPSTCERCDQRLRGVQQAQAEFRFSPKALKADKA